MKKKLNLQKDILMHDEESSMLLLLNMELQVDARKCPRKVPKYNKHIKLHTYWDVHNYEFQIFSKKKFQIFRQSNEKEHMIATIKSI